MTRVLIGELHSAFARRGNADSLLTILPASPGKTIRTPDWEPRRDNADVQAAPIGAMEITSAEFKAPTIVIFLRFATADNSRDCFLQRKRGQLTVVFDQSCGFVGRGNTPIRS